MDKQQPKPWSEQELKQMQTMIQNGKRLPEIAVTLGRSEKAVRIKSFKLGWSLRQASPLDDANVRCPFFSSLRQDGRIACEGVLRGAGCTISLFSDVEDWEKQVKTFCQKEYDNCPIAQVLQKKYE